MNSIISFIEKEPFELPPLPFRVKGDMAAPVYMIKDGKEYFVLNRTLHKPEHYDTDGIKATLTDNNGAYFAFYGIYKNPFDLVSYVRDKKYSLESTNENGRVFNNIESLFHDNHNFGSSEYFIGFSGNIREVSCAFCYRIYDVDIADKLKAEIRALQS